MKEIKETHKSYKLSHTKVISAGTIGLAAFFSAAFLGASMMQNDSFTMPTAPIEVEEDSEILLLNQIENQIINPKEGMEILDLKGEIENTIRTFKETNELSKEMEYALMVLEMRLENAVKENLSLDEVNGIIYPALIDGYAIKGKVIGRTKEDVEEEWGIAGRKM